MVNHYYFYGVDEDFGIPPKPWRLAQSGFV